MSMHVGSWRLILALLSGSVASVALADEVDERWKEDWKCGQQVTVPKDWLPGLAVSHAFMKDGLLPTFVIAKLGSADPSLTVVSPGLLLFVQGPTGWKHFPIDVSNSAMNIYIMPEKGHAVIFAMWTVEGPGQEYTVVSTQDGFKTVRCGRLPSPKAQLGTLDYMRILSFDGSKLIGTVHYAETEKQEWFESKTSDGGSTWSVPRKLASPAFEELGPTADGDHQDLISSIQQ